MQTKGLTIRDEDGNVVFESPSFEPIRTCTITACVQFDSATAEERIKALVAEYSGQPISPHRMEVIRRRAEEIALECMLVEVVPAAREATCCPVPQSN